MGDGFSLVLLTAVGVGGATAVGALLGFLFKDLTHRFSDLVLSFAAGVMLAAAVFGLIEPSFAYGSDSYGTLIGLSVSILGIFAGALCLNLTDKLVPHLHRLAGAEIESHENKNLGKILLFVLAIAIHNLPEGIAAGVSKKRTLLIALLTGFVEVVGTLVGFFAVSVAKVILPFALAFAGGTMLYIISDEMIPETHAHGGERGATYALLVGFALMFCMDILLG